MVTCAAARVDTFEKWVVGWFYIEVALRRNPAR
jgi:hypothetical protein